MVMTSYRNRTEIDTRELQKTERANVLAADVVRGMAVYDLNGVWLGAVSEIWAHNPGLGYLPRSKTYLNDYGPIAGSSAWFETGDGYIEITKPVAPRLTQRTHVKLEQLTGIQGEYVLVEGEGSLERPLARPNRFHGLNG